jgi:hypothetical protein
MELTNLVSSSFDLPTRKRIFRRYLEYMSAGIILGNKWIIPTFGSLCIYKDENRPNRLMPFVYDKGRSTGKSAQLNNRANVFYSVVLQSFERQNIGYSFTVTDKFGLKIHHALKNSNIEYRHA